jgi:ABC-type spermidine/putrescine transport system permease subunit II
VTAALPLLALAWLAAAWLGPRLDAVAPPLAARWLEPRPLPWAPAARGAGVVLSLGVLALVALPLASLADKVGRAGWPPAWSAEVAWQFFGNEARLHGADTLANAVLAALVAAAVSFLAWLACWLAQQSAPLRRLLFAIVALSWALPGPIIGIGLKTSIAWIVDRFPGGVVEQVFYQGPSPLPLAWAWGVRFFPFAAALLWPVVRLTPRESIEALRLESGSPWREFWVGFVPHTWRAYVLAALALTALSLAEVAASVRVDTPGWESYSKLLFDRMHYGVENNVAALALVLLLIVGAAAAALAAVVADIHKLCRRSR